MKKIFSVFLLAAALAAIMMLSASAVSIGSADALIEIMSDPSRWDEDITLTADIDLTGKIQQPIGTLEKPYTGTFDGKGHTVTLSIVSMNGSVGLIGAAKDASVLNLTVKGTVQCNYPAQNAEAKAGDNYVAVGGIVGTAFAGVTVENCKNDAKVVGPCNMGGVIGVVAHSGTAAVVVVDCENYGEFTCAYGNLGGIVGRTRFTNAASPAMTVINCKNYTDITYTSTDRARLGGIIGYVRVNQGNVRVENCANYGDLSAVNNATSSTHYAAAGGIVGRVETQSHISAGAEVVNCYNSGSITSSRYAGGISGYHGHGANATTYVTYYESCVNIGAINGGSYGGGIVAYTDAQTPVNIKNCLNTAPVDAVTGGGGITGRQRGVNITNCISVSRAYSQAGMGGLVGVAAGSIACTIEASYYPNINRTATGTIHETCTDSGSAAFDTKLANVEKTFGSLDFSGWVMGEKCPVPKTMQDVEIVITVGDLSNFEIEDDGPQEGSPMVVYHDRNATNDNDGLTPKTPKQTLGTMSTHLYSLIQNGGVIVCVGNSNIPSNYTFAKTYGPVTFTSVWDGVDYKNPLPADKPAGCFNVNSGLSLTVCSEITFDDIILFQSGEQNTVTVQDGGILVITDSVQLLSKPGLNYHYKLVVEEGGTAILSKAAKEKFTIVNEGGTVADYAGGTELKLTIGKLTGYVNGAAKTLDAAPIIKNGRTMLPVRFVAENLGGTVGWDGATSSVTIKGTGIDIAIKVGAATAKINGKTVTLDAPAFIESSRTYLPVRVVAEAMGATVAWDGATSTATLTK